MLRGLRLPGKLTFAALPLILALVALVGLLVQESLVEAERTRDTAVLAGSLDELAAALAAIGSEAAPYVEGTADPNVDPALRQETDAAVADFGVELRRVAADPLLRQFAIAQAGIEAIRMDIDGGLASVTDGHHRITEAYETASNDLLAVSGLMSTEAATTRSGRDLAALNAIARARLEAGVQDRLILEGLRESASIESRVARIADLDEEIDEWLSLFAVSATGPVRIEFEESGLPVVLSAADQLVGTLINSTTAGLEISQEEWQRVLDERWNTLVGFERALSSSVVARASSEADEATAEVWLVGAIGAGALLLAGIATALVARSIVRRVRAVTDRARSVSREQLPALVEALKDPSGEMALPPLAPIRDRGADEVGDLARSFGALQTALEEVAREQMETLHRGVADMFVTLARRNRSLIDRQLALIDQLEAHEEDPATLSDFYRLDHLATRMRRNAESLLVLAGTESHRTSRRPLDIDNVVRAAVGEIEDYRRVDILALEGLRIRGSSVTDLSHLLSELLENATTFSPPETRVRVAGHFHDDGYLLTVSDRGVGVGGAKLAEFNRLLASPPVIGLALEPTLGLYVVGMLAKRHGVRVKLVSGAPGVTAQIVLPPSMFQPEEDAVPARSNRADSYESTQDTDRSRIRPPEVKVSSEPRSVAPPSAPESVPVAPVAPLENPSDRRLPVRRPGSSLPDPQLQQSAATEGDAEASLGGNRRRARLQRSRRGGQGDPSTPLLRRMGRPARHNETQTRSDRRSGRSRPAARWDAGTSQTQRRSNE